MAKQCRSILDLRQFLQILREEKEIVEIACEVDPHLELAEIHRRVAAADGPALFFRNVKGSTFPVVTNLFGSKKRIDLAFQNRPEEILSELVTFLTRELPPSFSKLFKRRKLLSHLLKVGFKNKRSSYERMLDADATKLPFLTSWPKDGGAFLTLPLVYTEPPGGGAHNLGIYRMQRFSKKELGLHWQIQKGGGFHYHLAEEKNQELPVNVFLGGPPALLLSAIAPLPENVPELLFCSFAQGSKLEMTQVSESPYPLIKNCEFAIIGKAKPFERRLEGPFGDHYGYYSLDHEFPQMHIDAIYHKKDAIYPATIVCKPRQEDFYIGNYLQEFLSPLFPVVMPGIKKLWSYGETGFHALTSAVVKERFERECMTSAFRILGEGQLSLTKFLLLTNENIDVKDIKTVLITVLERFCPEKDLFIFSNVSMDTLDYTGPKLNHGSRGIMLGCGRCVRTLPTYFEGSLPSCIQGARPFCPGCLVLEGCPENLSDIARHSSFATWPLLILVDSLEKTLKSDTSFLWTVFTRFEPAQDIVSAKQTIIRNHIAHSGPLLIDARMKATYPEEVLVDEQTAELVTKRWSSYFTQPMPMGDSQKAHI